MSKTKAASVPWSSGDEPGAREKGMAWDRRQMGYLNDDEAPMKRRSDIREDSRAIMQVETSGLRDALTLLYTIKAGRFFCNTRLGDFKHMRRAAAHWAKPGYHEGGIAFMG